jgi:allantoicase
MVETLDSPSEARSTDSPKGDWKALLPQSPLQPHSRQRFEALAHAQPATHARLSIYPDGGIARLRLFGTLT